ncbi:MAG TPA: glutamine amidotransferase [Blastocatellia bacterium]|nr:glutamine amidotransferase [Blastocatellia bacterium]
MDQIVQFFFKYSRTVFAKGQFAFANRPSLAVIGIIAVLIGLLIYFLYIRSGHRITSGWQAGLAGLRLVLFALLAVLLLRPVIVVSSVIPKSSYVAVLADDSRSMQLADENGRSRGDAAKSLLAPDGRFARGLEAKFKTSLYGFSVATGKIKSANELKSEGAATDLAGAFKEVVKESTGIPLSAIVLVSDGGANTPRDLAAQLRELRARNLPVFVVGLGSTEKFKDAEMVRVTAPRRVLIGSAVIADALVRLNGYGNTKIAVAVSEDGRALTTKPFDVRGGETQTVTIEFTPTSPGAHRYTFTINPLDGETTTEDNAQEALVQVTNDNPKILYIEGEPRWEYGKMRWSLSKNEKNVVLVSSLRSADGKFYRQGVESGTELESGFPKTEEELFKYQGIILGSIEANFFSFDQLKMIEQFVARRGGGFLALGGSRSFDAGKYEGTPVADLLPFVLNGSFDESATPSLINFKAALTARGQTHAITRLAEDRGQSAKEWEALPPISIPEVLAQTKPGATVLLEARDVQNKGRVVPLLAEERYGRGRSLALVANDTWRWRMQMDSKNTSHETFWRQLLRYTISITPNQTEVYSERDVYAAGDAVTIRADVDDSKYETIKDAVVTARITRPSGDAVEVPLKFDFSEEGGNYRGEFKPEEQGPYKIDLTAKRNGTSVGTAQSNFLVTELNREFHDAAQNVELLKRIAAETGGKYFPLNKANDLLEEIQYLEGNNSERVSKDLWDMPINFLLIVGLASVEWFMRKKKGLA